MNILILTRRMWPQIGGVEKHVFQVAGKLRGRGHVVRIISEKQIKPLNIKYAGLVYIWLWLWVNRRAIEKAEAVYCQDVFIWYLPFIFIYPRKKVITIIHGLEWDNPLNPVSVWQKRLAVRLSSRSMGVGKFLEKYLHVHFDSIMYGASIKGKKSSSKSGYIYVGRLEANTGILNFLEDLRRKKIKGKVDFIGDGQLRSECEKYGVVHGFKDPSKFLRGSKYCVPGGYLAALEALSYGCTLKLYWNNKIKKDYWMSSPFVKRDVRLWAKRQTWDNLANEYIRLYNSIK